jgi:hypothetical protein
MRHQAISRLSRLLCLAGGRESGGLDYQTQSDAKRLLAPVAGKCGGHTEADEHSAGDVTFPAQVVTIALDPSPSRAGDQRVEPITRQAHQCEQQTEEGYLERHRAARGIDKLRQERQEEQRRFRIQQIDDETVAKQPS